MSARERTDYEEACLRFPCGHCGAISGAWCHVTRGARGEARDLHRSRYDQVQEIAELTGYRQEAVEGHRRAGRVNRAIRDLFDAVDGMDDIGSAWLRVRLSEILAVR